MGTERVIQASFSAGELSPHLRDRVDLEAYYSGCAELTNFIPLPHGPLLRRRGTHYIIEAKSSIAVRLIPFTFNVKQSFVLEFTQNCVRVFWEDGILLGEDENILEIPSPYENSDLSNIRWAQNGDWLVLVDGKHEPQVLKRYSNTNWVIEPLVFTDKPEEWTGTNQPSQVCFFEQRAYYAATPQQPQQIWASRTGLYENFKMKDVTQSLRNPNQPEGPNNPMETTTTVLDDHAFTYTLFSDDANGIQWLMPMTALVVGTSGAEFKLGSTSAIDPITPKNIRISVQTHYGSAAVHPVKVGAKVVFVTRSRQRLRAFTYSFMQDQYTAEDITIFASHILADKVKEMVIQSAPDSYIWLITDTGQLIGCTYEKDQKVLAWHKHELSGSVISLQCLPTSGNDVLYVAVRRQNRVYIERLVDAWEAEYDVTKAFYVDSGLTYEGDPTDDLVGLQHLEGKEVSVLVDGWVHPSVTVVNGSIHLQQPGSIIHVGLPYTSSFTSLVPQSQQNITMGSVRRISEATVALEKSLDFFYKANMELHAEVAYNGPTSTMNEAIPLTSRHQVISIPNKSSKVGRLELWQNRPVPLVIRAIVYTINPSSI